MQQILWSAKPKRGKWESKSFHADSAIGHTWGPNVIKPLSSIWSDKSFNSGSSVLKRLFPPVLTLHECCLIWPLWYKVHFNDRCKDRGSCKLRLWSHLKAVEIFFSSVFLSFFFLLFAAGSHSNPDCPCEYIQYRLLLLIYPWHTLTHCIMWQG